MKTLFVLCLYALFATFSRCDDTNYVYSVISSQIIQPNSTYDIVFQSEHATEILKFEFAIGKYEVDETFTLAPSLSSIKAELEPRRQSKVSIPIGSLVEDDYDLYIKLYVGDKETPHIKTRQLLYYKSKSNILMQTDKGVYKPGDKLQFRIVAIDENRLPKSNAIFKAYLTNNDGYRLKEWTNQALDAYGHFQDSFDFSQNIELGNYELTVEIENQKQTLSFELEEYILPLFSVDITAPKSASYEQPEIPILVSSKYTHGKKVRGTVSIKVIYRAEYWGPKEPIECFSVEQPINGQTETIFNLLSYDKLKFYPSSKFDIIATVIDSSTGMNYTGTNNFVLKTKATKIKLAIKNQDELLPGTKFVNMITGTALDGKPIEDSLNPVTIKYNTNYRDDGETFEAFFVNGTIPISFDIPLNSRFLAVSVEYKEKTTYLMKSQFYESTNSIEFVVFDEKNLINNKIKLIPADNSNDLPKVKTEIRTTVPIERFSWLVIANDKIILHQLVTTESKSNHEVVFDFQPSLHRGFRMIAYILPENTYHWIFAEARYEVAVNLMSELQISSSIQTGKPGDDPIISVEGLPDTFVALLGVDKSNILLKKPNLIDEEQLAKLVEEDDETKEKFSEINNYDDPAMFFKVSRFYFVTNIRYLIDYEASMEGIRGGIRGGIDEYSDLDELFENSLPDVKVRKDFPETWIWADAIIDPITKKATFKPKIPDSITTWVLNAFGVNTKTGLSVAHTPYELTVFNKFFIKANLPYSVVRDEIVTINVLVYNYLGKHKSVQVTLHNELGEFLFVKTASEFISGDNEVDHEEDQARQTRSVQVGNDEVASVSFLVRAKQVGHIKLQMVGQTEDGLAGDKVEQLLLVKPEGEVQRFNKALLISLKQSDSSKEFVERVPISIPLDVVPSSSLITVDAIADVLGTRLSNLDNLVRMPYGCGEQNMAGLVPNIVALNYLTKTNQLTETIKNIVIKNLESGYVRQLKYQHHNGGFSAFGENKYNVLPSTWLTAYVVNWFAAASKIITIDEKVLSKSVNFLLQNIDKEGHAVESGRLFDKHMSGGVVGDFDVQTSPALDAFVLMALNQAKSIGLVNESNLIATIQALESFVTDFKKADENDKSRDRDFFTLAIVSAALNQVGSSKASQAFEHLWTLRQTDASLRLFFDKPKRNETVTKSGNLYYAYLSQPNSNSVEATAYALSVLTSRNDVENGLRVIQWLISKQNSNGGWSSTQDTVVAMNALAQFAASTYEPNTNLNVVFASKSKSSEEGKPAFQGSFDLNKSNSLVLQKSEWNERGFKREYKQLKEIEVKGKGAGTAVVQVSWQYNVVKKDQNNVFAITHKVNQPSASSFVLEVCAKYSEEGETNMAIVSVETPSGFEYDLFEVNNLRQSNQQIQRIDVNSQNNQASFYFNSINKEGVCFNVTLNRVNCVYNLKPALINVYDYYQTTKASRYFYEIPIKTAC